MFFLVLIINSTYLLSQKTLKQDTGFITPRSFNSTTLNELKKQEDFQYNKTHEPVISLWDKFWNWVWWKAGQLLSTKQGRITVWSVLIIMGIAIMIFFVVKLSGMDQEGLFGRSNKDLQPYTLSQNDIHKISFDDEIEKAANNADYRLATRLQYLRALKRLSDKRQIDWKLNKTNNDYLFEIAGKPFHDIFRGLTFNFEHIWYGGKQISKGHFLEISEKFQQFNNQV